jgi:hypothetical protein
MENTLAYKVIELILERTAVFRRERTHIFAIS